MEPPEFRYHMLVQAPRMRDQISYAETWQPWSDKEEGHGQVVLRAVDADTGERRSLYHIYSIADLTAVPPTDPVYYKWLQARLRDRLEGLK